MNILNIIIVITMLVIVGVDCFRQQGNAKTVGFTVWMIFTVWANVPNFVVLPAGVVLSDGLATLPFKLYQSLGFFYIVISNVLLALFGIYLGRELNREKRYTAKQVKEKFDEFSADATELKIIGRDLDFLHDKKNDEFKQQQNVVVKLKNQCQLLCEPTTNLELLDMYYGLMKKGVKIRCYADSSAEITRLRGQIKVDGHGNQKAVIITKTNDCCNNSLKKRFSANNVCYEVLDMTNAYIIDSVSMSFDGSFNNGRNPLIKYIALDLGGVYLSGDIKTFYDYLEKNYNIIIKPNKKDKVNIDNELMLGNKTIRTFIEGKMTKSQKKQMTEEGWKNILTQWGKTWEVQKSVKKLVEDLLDLDYVVVPFSNLDKDNGDLYDRKDYLPSRCTIRYFSYEKGKTKPHENAFKKFEYMLSEELTKEIRPYQILLIDDQNENISMAKKVGWESVKFSNAEEDGFNNLVNKLKTIGVLPQNYNC